VNLSRLLDPCFTPGAAAFRRIDPAAGSSRSWGPIAVEHCAGRTVLRIDPAVLAQLAKTGILKVIGKENVFVATPQLGEALNQAVAVANAWLGQAPAKPPEVEERR